MPISISITANNSTYSTRVESKEQITQWLESIDHLLFDVSNELGGVNKYISLEKDRPEGFVQPEEGDLVNTTFGYGCIDSIDDDDNIFVKMYTNEEVYKFTPEMQTKKMTESATKTVSYVIVGRSDPLHGRGFSINDKVAMDNEIENSKGVNKAIKDLMKSIKG